MAFEGLSEKLTNAFKKIRSKGRLTEQDVRDAMREVKLALLEADVSYKVTKAFISAVTEKAVGEEVLNSLTPAQQVIKIVNDELVSLMGGENQKLRFSSTPPTVVMMCGLQGSGKTTHSAKLARMFLAQGKRPLLVACDVYRPAAIEQLKIVGAQAGVSVFEMGQGDPVKIASEAVRYAKDHGNDLVILDTAGRLQIDEKLMGELSDIKKAVHPNEILLVVDSMTGQEAVNVADTFNKALDISGVILTKLDGDTRGGAALSVRYITGKPIKFAGIGEKLDEIEPFYPERMASRILGMGDVMTLIEKAQTQIDEKTALEMEKKFKQNTFDFNDLSAQMSQIQKMGSIKQILSMIPGAGSKIKDEDIDERQFDKVQALICSMTPGEREKPEIITPPRKRRIAQGAGAKVEDVNRLLKQLEQMRGMMKQLGGGRRLMKKRRKK